MIKKSRLRTQKQKKGRRVILFLLIFAVLGMVGYYLEQYYGITAYLKDVLQPAKDTLSQNSSARGTFYDRNLKQLAITLERVSVYARTREIDSIQETATKLSDVLDLDKEILEDQLKNGVLRLWIAKDISQEQEIAIKNLHLPGVYLQRADKRFYPNDFRAAHFIGSVENGIGLSGVEFYYDRLLAGRKLQQEQERQPLSDSLDLVLTIDLKIQDILEDLVKDIALGEQAEKVAAYLLESETGEIIAGANLPGFNPNTFARYSQEQTEDMFLLPLCIPGQFRLFLRDAARLHAYAADNVSPLAWSLVPLNDDIGSQLRLWEWLGLEEPTQTDFYVPTLSGKKGADQQEPVNATTQYVGFVPESATPLSLLTACSILLNESKKIRPFVVKKVLDKETSVEVLLSGKEGAGLEVDGWSAFEGEQIKAIFHSMARKGGLNAYYLRDDILVSVGKGVHRKLFVNDFLFVTMPAGNNEVHMLIVVQRNPQGVHSKADEKKKSIEQLVEEKVERISVLQQISKSVADVREPEVGALDNFQGDNELESELSQHVKLPEKEKASPGVMPDLRGLSLRKSLRQLQGINLELKIQGTGRVVTQKPLPGTSLRGVAECFLMLEKQEKIVPKKFSTEVSGKETDEKLE